MMYLFHRIEQRLDGTPAIIVVDEGWKALDDAIFVDEHPLAGAQTFTWEAIFRPDSGGAAEQRWFHLAEQDPKTGADTDNRMLFEIRVVGSQWYLDAFVHTPVGNQPIQVPEKLYPLDTWHAVAQVYDGKKYRSYVDGELQGEFDMQFQPQGPGHSSVGVRINKRDYFKGAVRSARFTRRALTPAEFLKVPAKAMGKK